MTMTISLNVILTYDDDGQFGTDVKMYATILYIFMV